ncbi:proteasome component domain protein [Striga asiatica]|uniref:Proteasome component domain protein n=1 Tax=Striga asiatica TaxID=4170 RepID=A0A5A7P5J7_STRAF|nr:proteasome component domain protein [Striga asiatica]
MHATITHLLKRRADKTGRRSQPARRQHRKRQRQENVQIQKLKPYCGAQANGRLQLEQPLQHRTAYVLDRIPDPDVDNTSDNVQAQPQLQSVYRACGGGRRGADPRPAATSAAGRSVWWVASGRWWSGDRGEYARRVDDGRDDSGRVCYGRGKDYWRQDDRRVDYWRQDDRRVDYWRQDDRRVDYWRQDSRRRDSRWRFDYWGQDSGWRFDYGRRDSWWLASAAAAVVGRWVGLGAVAGSGWRGTAVGRVRRRAVGCVGWRQGREHGQHADHESCCGLLNRGHG